MSVELFEAADADRSVGAVTKNANETDPLAAQSRELSLLAQAYATTEHKEAVAAFLEKRKPVFR